MSLLSDCTVGSVMSRLYARVVAAFKTSEVTFEHGLGEDDFDPILLPLVLADFEWFSLVGVVLAMV